MKAEIKKDETKNTNYITNAINTIFDFGNYESGLDDMLKNAIYPKDIKKRRTNHLEK